MLMSAWALSAAGLLGACMTGCVGYAHYPPLNEPGQTFNQVNNFPVPQVLAEAAGFIARRYPPVADAQRGVAYEGPIAVSLPPGATVNTSALVAERMGPNCEPAMTSNADRPTYKVSRVNVRGTTAEIDFVFPAPQFKGMGSADERYQGATVYLAGGTQRWRVTGHRLFGVGILDVPERNEIDVQGSDPSAPTTGSTAPIRGDTNQER
jgi:hypothetical protein